MSQKQNSPAYQLIYKWLQDPEDLMSLLIERLSQLLISIPMREDIYDESQLDAWSAMLLLEKGMVYLLSQTPMPNEDTVLRYTAILTVMEMRWLQNTNPIMFSPMAQIEGKVGHWLPKTAPDLNEDVRQKYRLLISQPPHEANTIRYLLGFADALTNASAQEFSDLLQFVSRRRTEIPLPTGWPIPSYVNIDRNDPIWFVFGVVMHFWPKKTWILNKFKIFTWNYKNKSCKTARIGFVLSVHKGLCKTWDNEIAEPRPLSLTPYELEWMEGFIKEGTDAHYKLTSEKLQQRIQPMALQSQGNNGQEDPEIQEILYAKTLANTQQRNNKNNKNKDADALDKTMDQWKNQKFFMEFVPRTPENVLIKQQSPFPLTQDEKEALNAAVKPITLNNTKDRNRFV